MYANILMRSCATIQELYGTLRIVVINENIENWYTQFAAFIRSEAIFKQLLMNHNPIDSAIIKTTIDIIK